MHLTIHELDALRYQLAHVSEPMAAAAKAVLVAEARHHLAAAEREDGFMTSDPNERLRRHAQAQVHRALHDYCLAVAANPPPRFPDEIQTVTAPPAAAPTEV